MSGQQDELITLQNKSHKIYAFVQTSLSDVHVYDCDSILMVHSFSTYAHILHDVTGDAGGYYGAHHGPAGYDSNLPNGF